MRLVCNRRHIREPKRFHWVPDMWNSRTSRDVAHTSSPETGTIAYRDIRQWLRCLSLPLPATLDQGLCCWASSTTRTGSTKLEGECHKRHCEFRPAVLSFCIPHLDPQSKTDRCRSSPCRSPSTEGSLRQSHCPVSTTSLEAPCIRLGNCHATGVRSVRWRRRAGCSRCLVV
jgi:hypothetical protein